MKYIYLLLLSGLIACSSQPEAGHEAFWGHHFAFAKDIAYGQEPKQKLDIWFQGQWIGEPTYWKTDTLAHPTLVYIHGGGWLGGSKDGIMPFILPFLERGYNVVTLDYRVGEASAPAAVDDCMMALKWLQKESKNYNIDPQNIVLSGESAGGHLALISGFLNAIPGSHPDYIGDKLKIKAVVNWFGITDIAGIHHFFAGKGEPENYASIWSGGVQRMDSISAIYSPLHRVSVQSPAVISIHGQKDSVVPHEQAVKLHQLLSEKGVKNQLLSIPEGKHLGFNEEDFQMIYTKVFGFIGR